MRNVKRESFDKHFNEIKQEIIEFEESKTEERSDVLIKIDHDYTREYEYLQSFSINISKETKEERSFCDTEETDLYVGISGVKQEACEFIQPKTESELLTLTTHIDLPTLKDECTYLTSYFNEANCKQSERIFKDTTGHGSKNRKRNYPCPVCSRNFPSSRSSSTHIGGHFKKRHAVCQFCGKLMKQREFFQHCFIHAVKNRTKNRINDKALKCILASKMLKQKNIENVKSKSFQCGTCFKIFNRKSYLQRHLKIHSGEKPFKCNICSKRFNGKSCLQRHLKIHSGEKPFKCNICSKRFNRIGNLRQHLLIHSSEKPFKCNICSKGFTQKSQLQRHIIIHTSEKSSKCDICSKGFTHKYFLQIHLTTHTNEKSFKCDICSRGFNNKFYLKQHLVVHYVKKPFKCNICSKGFTRKSNLRRHFIIHTREKPFKCYICSKRFYIKSSLKTHLISHSIENSLKCEVCFKEFSQKSDLQTHLISHSIENSLKCDVCFKEFSQKSDLQTHLIVHNDIYSKIFKQKFKFTKTFFEMYSGERN